MSYRINCEELRDGTSGLSSLSKKTRKCNHLQMPLQRKHFLLSYLKTLSVGPAGAWAHDLLHGSPALYQLSQLVGTPALDFVHLYVWWCLSMFVCFADGSEAVFYLSHNPDSKHWVVQLQAGGSCGTYDSCLDRSRGSFGSSRNYSDFLTGTFVASGDPAENSMFSSWNKVFVPYCR